jgi:putative oxidoreductase
MKHLSAITCFLLILVFCYSAFTKLADQNTFRDVLARGIFPDPVAFVLSFALPLLELGTAGLLFFPNTRKAGLLLSLLLLNAFTVYLVYMILFAPDLPCSCGGVLEALSWKQHVIFNLFLIILTLLAILHHYKMKEHEPITTRRI